ncbi:MAG: glutamate racemase [bacterium (Candidatus Stahlbacteria) CG23_combo_of_CG06-09_8_20_14_all_34_7]|nr:MAG: glutamate racemase [bacterium (Candidatus Stahlbacteria) CG23_combo_of_CG06-09_8_20_14_all_34_7]
MKRKIQSKPIGIFDSGVGGLTVLNEVVKHLPNENIIYFGDTARVPYGSKSVETIKKFAIQDSKFLISMKVKMIVVACNTVSSNAMNILHESFDIPFVDVLLPNAMYASQITRKKRIGVIGTAATIESGAYSKIINKFNKTHKVFSLATPLLVPLAEEGLIDNKATNIILEDYLSNLKEYDIDTLILGCTHYPLFEKRIKEIVGKDIQVVNSARQTARTVKSMLEDMGILNLENKKGDVRFYLSDIPRNFRKIAQRFLKQNTTGKVLKINIENF